MEFSLAIIYSTYQRKGVLMKRALAFVLLLAISVIAAPTASLASDSNPYGTSTIDPAAPNEVILTIKSASATIDFTYQELLRLPHTSISVYEPFIKKRQRFTVITLSTLFKRAGIKPNAIVITKALNDYTFTAKASDFISAQGLLALKRDGAAIPYDQGGPIRIIFPDKSRWARNLDAWNWSINSMRTK